MSLDGGPALDGNVVSRTCDGVDAGWDTTIRVTMLDGAYDEHGRFDSKIFESAHHFRIESNRMADSNSNRISKLRRSLGTGSPGLSGRNLESHEQL